MARRSPGNFPREIHVETFLTRRVDRRKVVATCRKLYRVVRPFTEARGGWGPRLYLLKDRPRRGPGPVAFRSGVRARPSEDQWIEVAIYPTAQARRSIIRELWANEHLRAILVRAESYNVSRRGSWLIGLGEFRA